VQVVAKLLGVSSSTVGLDGSVPPVQAGKTSLIVPPLASAPPELVNPHVQSA
jgi:hypothetical protein